jgi:predicted aspartyl protease
MMQGFPVAEGVYIDGSGPYRFLVDSGAETSMISPELARRLGLRPTYAVIQVTAAAERTVPAHVVSELTLGDATVRKAELMEAPLQRVREAAGRIEGVLGQNFLGQFAWLLDLERGRLLFDLDRTHRRAGRCDEPRRSGYTGGRR